MRDSAVNTFTILKLIRWAIDLIYPQEFVQNIDMTKSTKISVRQPKEDFMTKSLLFTLVMLAMAAMSFAAAPPTWRLPNRVQLSQ